MRQRNKGRWAALLLTAVICLTGCTEIRGTLRDGRIVNTNENISGSYELFTGEATYEQKFTGGDYVIRLASTTYAGDLKITVRAGNETEVYDKPQGVSKVWHFDRPTKVEFDIEGNEHSGDFAIVWERGAAK